LVGPGNSVGANLPIEGSNSGATTRSTVAPGANSRLWCFLSVGSSGTSRRLAETSAFRGGAGDLAKREV